MSRRRVRYQVAASLDGYIAGPNGEHDWIPMDPDIDFAALLAQFDTVLMGRRTYEPIVGQGWEAMPGMNTYVFSTTLRKEDHPDVTIVASDADSLVERLRTMDSKKDIWLFGGGRLFLSLAEMGMVDTVEVAVIPVILSSGVPLVPDGSRIGLALTGHKAYPKSGIMALEYRVVR